VLSSQYRPLSHYLPAELQPGDEPAHRQSLREYRVMSLKTRFGNLKNVLDEDSSQTEILVLDSPFVGNAQFDEMVAISATAWSPSTAPSRDDGAGRAAPRAGTGPVRRRRMPCARARAISS
jgi:glutamate synthase (NADPH/NADH) large chain